MSQKVRKTLIMIVMAALIICLMAASLTYTFTYGRYTGKDFDAEKSPYDDLIEFVGANQYLVYSPEELIQAIKDGYSNIQIADEAEQPFVITEGVTDVTANLVLDVNGKTLIRNSRNPMLDVQTNVSVVLVYDSSDEGQGGFYNPVGSALQASGGTLTVGSGSYDDGPKGTDSDSDVSQSTSATLVTRNARTDTSYGAPSSVTGLPKIEANHYFAEDASTGSFNATYIKPDTFLILTYEDDCELDASNNLITGVQTEGDAQTGKALTVPCNAASCDFYYYYKVGNNPTTSETETNTYAVIYGYNDVKALAQDAKEKETDEEGMATALKDSGLIYPYAAVRMEEGEGFARGGQFSNNFGTANSYGIYANGGALTASGANFTTGGEGVCIGCEGSADLDVSGGSFSSEVGNTIEMSGGNMTVTKGTFTKSGGKGIGSGENQAQQQVANQTAMIDMQGGKLTINGADANSVTMTAGGTENGDTLTNVFGILAHSGGEVSVGGCTFNINGNYSAGVLSYDGTINLNANTVINVTEEHPENQLTSAGVSSERDTSATSSSTSTAPHPINMKGNVQITSNGLGITARGMINVLQSESGTTTVTVKTENATGIVVSGDADETDEDRQATLTVKSDATLSVVSKINSSLKWVNAPGHTGTGDTNVNNGIYVENGSIDASAGTLNVTHTGVAGDTPTATTDAATKSYAVFVKGNTATNNQTTSVSIGAGTITGTNAGGVYVVGTSKQDGEQTTYTATVTLGGVNITAQNTYAAGILTETGNVIIDGNAQITSSALGIAVINGNVGVSASTSASVKATRATGVYVRGGTLYNQGTLSVESDLADENNNNSFYQHTGADISTPSTDPNPYNGVYVKGGSLNSTGTLKVTFTGVQNDQNQTDDKENALTGANAYRLFEIKSYAVRVEGSGDTTVTITSGNITNAVGGGVLVNGGTVTLGTTGEGAYNESTKRGLTVQTEGHETFKTEMNAGPGGNWIYKLPKTGGPAIKVTQSESVSSTLTVYGGTYTAQQGDGIVTVGGTSYIHNGTFIGRDYGVGSGDRAGPGASYSFKVYGGTANVYGGTFGSSSSIASGAFVMGTSTSSMGTANIYGGSFVVSSGNSGGQAGFSVYEYGNVLVDPGKGGEQQNLGGDVKMTGLAAGLVIEGNTSNKASVEIRDGTFSSTRNHGNSDGIWYSNSKATLMISGGTFTGYARSGLWLDVTPEIYDEGWMDGHGRHYSTNVKITGGGFKGNGYAIFAKESGYWESGSWNERPSYAIGVNYIIVPGSLLRTDNWNRATAEEGIEVGYGQGNPDYWNDALEGTIINCKKIAVGQYYIETWWQQN